jgi:CRP/FNR family transcriptional regulator, cyclic AMP receptor protein
MATDLQRLQLLRRVWLFEELEDGELDHIAATARERACRAGEALVRQGDGSGDLFSVVQGRLKVTSVAVEGEKVLLSIMGPGDIFGEIALLDEAPRSATVIAAEPCRLLVLPRAAFRALLRQMPDLALRLLQVMAGHVRRLSARTEDSFALDVRARLAKALLSLAERFGVPGPGGSVRITLKMSQQELGQLVGATREMVNRCLREWVSRRIIRHTKSVVAILNVARMTAIAQRRGPGRRSSSE